MKKSFSAIMVVIGTVIGSGFASGKEIAVFYSRFGAISYFFIGLTFFLFWGLIYFFLSFGERAVAKLSSSKIFSVICLIISLIFTSSMIAGTINVLPQNAFARVGFLVVIVAVCMLVSRRGMPFLSKLNIFIIPITLVCLAVVLGSILDPPTNIASQNGFAGLFFALLYAVLNFSISGIVISKTGTGMTKKQKVLTSFIASLTLSVFLVLTNTAILSHSQSISKDMPLVFLSSGVCSFLIRFVIFSGCITTLFSLVFTTSLSLKKFGLKQKFIDLVAIFLPIAISLLGFGRIVSFLYPFASVLGIVLLLLLLMLPSENKNSS